MDTALNREKDIYECIEDMIDTTDERVKHGLELIKKCIKKLMRTKQFDSWQKEMKLKRKGETVLHTAINLLQFNTENEKEVVKLLINTFPQLVREDRETTEYAGQTSLHVAVCKGNKWLVETLLAAVTDGRRKRNLLSTKATGIIFHNTVMMGELPLTIAALTFNKEIFDLLLENDAELDGLNSNEDNVCHSLIRYAYLYLDKMEDVLEMCRHLCKDKNTNDGAQMQTVQEQQEHKERNSRIGKLRKKIWLMSNEQGLNPLQLAASYGLHEIFCFIMEREGYCRKNCRDGLFDIKIYDITEIDAISGMKSEEIKGTGGGIVKGQELENVSKQTIKEQKQLCKKSVMMMLLDLEPYTAFQFVLYPPLRRVVSQKWLAYRKMSYCCWFVYLIFMTFLTWYCTERSHQLPNMEKGNESVFDIDSSPVFAKRIPTDPFVTAYGIIALIVGSLFLIQEGLRMGIRRMPWQLYSFVNPYDNGWFRLMFVVLGLFLILDFVFTFVNGYEHYFLVFAVVIGWILNLFFLRVVRPFSFFTVLIQKVFFVDMSRFFVVLCIEVVGFSTAIYMVLQGSDAASDPDFSSFWRVLFSMFNLMIGVGDLAYVYNTRHPGLCIAILIIFIVMTTILMLNCLIAMISRTCMELVEDVGNIRAHYRHLKLQQLSMILFLESVLPKRFIHKVGKQQSIQRYSSCIQRRINMKRFMLEVRSLESGIEKERDIKGLLRRAFRVKPSRQEELELETQSISCEFEGRTDGELVDARNEEENRTDRNNTDNISQSNRKVLDVYGWSVCNDCQKTEAV